MKREFLQEFRVGEQALPKEVIDAIMAENGRDIQKVKGNFSDYEQVKADLERLQQEAQQTQEHRLEAQQWQEKYHRAVEDHNQQLEEMAFRQELQEQIQKARGRNAKAITALLDLESLKSGEDRSKAMAEALEVLKKDCRYLFEEEVPPPYAYGTGAYQGSRETRPTTLAGALREKFERK